MWKEYQFKNSTYLVNEYGDIISKASGRKLKKRLNKDGYWYVTIGTSKSKNRPQTRTGKAVHIIVATLFVENPDPVHLIEVDHIDFDRTNCYYKNLRWVTHKQNIEHSTKAGRWYNQQNDCSGANNFNAKLTKEQVIKIRAMADNGISIYQIAKEFNRGWTTIKHIIDRNTWKNI